MSGEKDYSMHDLRKDMLYLKEKVSKLDVTINGPDDSAEPMGLKHHVGQNTQFRSGVNKLLWMLVSAVVGIITYLVTSGIT